jgi:serine phosphatase RsbU (regulator of sigma subunit)
VSQDGQALGVIQLDSQDLRRQFTQDDLDVLASVACQSAFVMENAALHEELVKSRELERDLEFATQVQLGFLPTEKPRLAAYDFFDHYEAAQRVGGDFFDYVPLPGGRLAVCVGDVAGKGVPAALLMARMYSAARYYLLSESTPALAMAALNAGIASSGLGFRFITFAMAVLDADHHRVTLANAGHLPPILRTRAGAVSKVGQEISGLPLGVRRQGSYEQLTFSLDPGDCVVMYTDGVTETMNPQNEIFGLDRLMEYLGASRHAGVDELGRGLMQLLDSFCEGQPQRDDTCLICFSRRSA